MTPRDPSLGVEWVHGSFVAVRLNGQVPEGSWSSPSPVESLDQFRAALGEAVRALGFDGGKLHLVLESAEFAHRPETAPAGARAGARYVRALMRRHERERGRAVWAAQPLQVGRGESVVLVHSLSADFYHGILRAARERRLRLQRLVPLSAAMERLAEPGRAAKPAPSAFAVEAGRCVSVLLLRPEGAAFFARTIPACGRADPVRAAVELNRSLLFGKQRFGAAIERAQLLVSGEVEREIRARCPMLNEVEAVPPSPSRMVAAAAALPVRHPLNIVAAEARLQRGRHWLGRGLVAAAWLAALLAAFHFRAVRDAGAQARVRLADLRGRAPATTLERVDLDRRDALARTERTFLKEASDERVPPVAERFLEFLAGHLPAGMRLDSFEVRADPSGEGWPFRLEGEVAGDRASAGECLANLERSLRESRLHVRLGEPRGRAEGRPPARQVFRFVVEGGLFES